MHRIITEARMRAAEAAYLRESGIPSIDLMERAAEAVAREALRMSDGGILLLCGPGNNGGDGYAAARLLFAQRRPVWVWSLCDPDTLRGDARANMERCAALGIRPQTLASLPEKPPEGCALLIDALFGTGLSGPLQGTYADAVRWINASGLPVLAVDMPSGMGETIVRANVTVTFHRMKPCHLLFPGRAHAGDIRIADIGLPDIPFPDDFELLEASDIPALLPKRPPDAHKGDCGHALIIAGSPGMAGAAALSANGALRGGAGLVTVLCPEKIMPIVQTLAPCATCASPERLKDALIGKHSIAVGPGLGAPDDIDALLSALFDVSIPQIWDADALNWLAKHPKPLPKNSVITPHPGEASRLLGIPTHAVVADPVTAAEALFQRYQAVTLLKGATTVVIHEGRRAFDTSGCPGMATGGTGDVLTGIIAALLAQGLPPFDAARLGALLHGRAGEAAAHARGERSMTAEDLLAHLRID